MEDQIARPRLTSRERRVLRMRYWLHMTQRQVGKQIGVSQPAVHYIERDAIAKIRSCGGFVDVRDVVAAR